MKCNHMRIGKAPCYACTDTGFKNAAGRKIVVEGVSGEIGDEICITDCHYLDGKKDEEVTCEDIDYLCDNYYGELEQMLRENLIDAAEAAYDAYREGA